jgi:hypothetical protein
VSFGPWQVLIHEFPSEMLDKELMGHKYMGDSIIFKALEAIVY